MIIGLVITGLCLMFVLIIYLLLGRPGPTILASILALPTGIAVVVLLLFLDRLEPEPPLRLLFAFLWGAGVSALFALIINSTGILFLSSRIGVQEGMVIGASVIGPIVEETLKGTVLLLLLWRRRDDIDGPTDGIIYAGMVGIGFAVVEDINYYSESLDSAATLIAVVIMRGVLSPLLHPLFTSMTGLGVAYAANHRGGRGALAVIAGWLVAICLHAMWNFSSEFGLIGLAVAYGICLLAIIGLIILLVRDRRRTVRLIQQYLPMYDNFGIVTPADVTMLSSLRGRAQARRWVRARLGRPAGKAMVDYQLAATELALLHSHAASRTVSQQRFAFRQHSLVQLMSWAHAAFAPALLPSPAPGFVPPPWHR
ncbi:PrsW family intramembrane metalloprotease [Microlunatus elymi]|uniref:PrsW family intramembrane metalloprotease n=1 Tax=Microlunatus elymi TaxID=2596828 RepID=A0A516Q5R9_9ACTN|nr:PrsW family intramembrane metalloprotease [Microlunatus elymi]